MSSKKDLLRQVFTDLEAARPSLNLSDLTDPIVPGVGNPDSSVVFIGEAPGYHESVQGEPFVGRSGQLFTKTLEDQGIKRTDVYITNIVKIRPPENRDPFPEEILAFKPYLDKEIEIISPQLIVTLGRFSMGKFLPGVKISQVHGRLHRILWQGMQLHVLPMYHPAAALRSTQMKLSFEADFVKIPKVLQWLKDHWQDHALVQDAREALL